MNQTLGQRLVGSHVRQRQNLWIDVWGGSPSEHAQMELAAKQCIRHVGVGNEKQQGSIAFHHLLCGRLLAVRFVQESQEPQCCR